MNLQFTLESFKSLSDDWKNLQAKSQNGSIFTSLEWSQVWWQQFGSDYSLSLASVKNGGRIIGIAPLLRNNDVASFIGGTDVCDYLDFVVETGEEESFFTALLENLPVSGITRLDLAHVRPESLVLKKLASIAEIRGLEVSLIQEETSSELDLPATWDEYLQLLNGKQRHELKRKLRRLDELGEINYRTTSEAHPDDLDIFLRLFRDSRRDKAAFLTAKIESFFRSLADAMAEINVLRLNILELDSKPVAVTMCFDYKNDTYLYNSGYDPEYRWLSAGLISKALCIKDSIHRGRRRFDFLKGNEQYKQHLGGHDIPLYRCTISF